MGLTSTPTALATARGPIRGTRSDKDASNKPDVSWIPFIPGLGTEGYKGKKGLPSARVSSKTMSPEELDDEMEALQPARANRGRVIIAGAALLSSALFAINNKQDISARARANVELARKAVRETVRGRAGARARGSPPTNYRGAGDTRKRAALASS